jgi:hypothetical protein
LILKLVALGKLAVANVQGLGGGHVLLDQVAVAKVQDGGIHIFKKWGKNFKENKK